jgi:hypothetical protein
MKSRESFPIVEEPRSRHTADIVLQRMRARTNNEMEESVLRYYAAHPGSPAAVRRPRLQRRGNLWVALLGYSIKDGIAGFGPNVEAALRAFDVQYLNTIRPPVAA